MSTAALPVQVALVSESRRIPFSALAPVAAALTEQVHRDFAPVWHVNAVVAAYERVSQVPHGVWPILIQDTLDDPSALGYHTDSHHQPLAFVEATPDWTVTCSHELLEMLADPWGNRLYGAASPAGDGQRVHILVEVADPCEAVTYDIGGVTVSDFAYPSWYHTVRRLGHQYSVTGQLSAPRELLNGGYVSYVAADGTWWQETWFGAQPKTVQLGRLDEFAEPGDSLRQAVDRATRQWRANPLVD